MFLFLQPIPMLLTMASAERNESEAERLYEILAKEIEKDLLYGRKINYLIYKQDWTVRHVNDRLVSIPTAYTDVVGYFDTSGDDLKYLSNFLKALSEQWSLDFRYKQLSEAWLLYHRLQNIWQTPQMPRNAILHEEPNAIYPEDGVPENTWPEAWEWHNIAEIKEKVVWHHMSRAAHSLAGQSLGDVKLGEVTFITVNTKFDELQALCRQPDIWGHRWLDLG